MFGYYPFDIMFFVFLSPALLLMVWAQWRIKVNYERGMQYPTRLSGAEAARAILDDAGLRDVAVEPVDGYLSDHYDPRGRVLRLSPGVYQSRSATAVGIAAHEAGHALQHATHYAPLVVRNLAVPAATFGPGWFTLFFFGAILFQNMQLIWIGLLGYIAVALFQIINLPVEYDASARAKKLVYDMGIVDGEGQGAVANVLDAAALTYVAATLQSILTVLYYVFRLTGSSREN
jgi:Zn-dependent membrane protease YugP